MTDEYGETVKEEESMEQAIEKNRKQAKEVLDQNLSRKAMEFCSRCSRKLDSRMEVGGRCMYEGCSDLICIDCWSTGKKFCKKHAMAIKDEEGGRPQEKTFFRPAPEQAPAPEKAPSPEPAPDIAREMHPGQAVDDARAGSIAAASKFIEAFVKHLDRLDTIDWTPDGYFENPKFRADKIKEGEMEAGIFSKKHFWSKKLMLRIYVRPLSSTKRDDVEILLRDAAKKFEKSKAYNLYVMACADCPPQTADLVKGFSAPNMSAFLVSGGKIIFDHEEKKSRPYAAWMETTKEPMNFKALLRSLSDTVSGRLVLDADKVVDAFGFSKEQADKILKSCRFLSNIEDTDKFLFSGDAVPKT
jgi:hypothetical protein